MRVHDAADSQNLISKLLPPAQSERAKERYGRFSLCSLRAESCMRKGRVLSMTCQPPRLHQQHTKRLAESILTTFRKFQTFIQMLISYIKQARQFSPTDARGVYIKEFLSFRVSASSTGNTWRRGHFIHAWSKFARILIAGWKVVSGGQWHRSLALQSLSSAAPSARRSRLMPCSKIDLI